VEIRVELCVSGWCEKWHGIIKKRLAKEKNTPATVKNQPSPKELRQKGNKGGQQTALLNAANSTVSVGQKRSQTQTHS